MKPSPVKPKKLVHMPLKVFTVARESAPIDIDEDDDIQEVGVPDQTIPNQQQSSPLPPAPAQKQDQIDQTSPKNRDPTRGIMKHLQVVQQQSPETKRFSYEFEIDDDLFWSPKQQRPRYKSFKQMLQAKNPTQIQAVKIEPSSKAKKPLVQALVAAGVDYQRAAECRRQLIVFNETLLNLQPRKEATENMEIKQNVDYARRALIEKKVNQLKQKLSSANTIDEELGQNRGVASVYIPSRVFFGYSSEPPLSKLTFTNPHAVEEEIDYEQETAGFDEDESELSTDEESAEASADANDENELLEQREDDIGDVDDDTGLLKLSGLKKMRRQLEMLQKIQSELTYPAPVLCPDAVSGQKGALRVFDCELVKEGVAGFDSDRAGAEQCEKENVLYVYGARIPEYLRPIIAGMDGVDLKKDYAFILKPEAEDEGL